MRTGSCADSRRWRRVGSCLGLLAGGWLIATAGMAAAAPPAPVPPPPPVTAAVVTAPVVTAPPVPVTPSLEVSATTGLDPAGAIVTVTGSGYDVNRGIYVAFCVVPPPGGVPTPCGGGIDLEGATGASQWISSAPPDYGIGLAQTYGPGGSFQVDLAISALLSPTIDCRTVQCAVVTRADHTRLADRSLDVIVPVFFDAVSPVTTAPGSPAPTPPTAAPTVPPNTVPTVPPNTVATVPSTGSEGDDADASAGSELPAPRGATATWPVWAGTAGIALGLVALAPKRRKEDR